MTISEVDNRIVTNFFTFVKRVCGPISQRSPITVSPSSIVPGCKIVSDPTVTSELRKYLLDR